MTSQEGRLLHDGVVVGTVVGMAVPPVCQLLGARHAVWDDRGMLDRRVGCNSCQLLPGRWKEDLLSPAWPSLLCQES